MYTAGQREILGVVFMVLVIVGLLYVIYMRTPYENFADSGRCGWSLGVCPDGLRCINGYCKSDVAPKLPALSDLPLRPDRYTAPIPAHYSKTVGVCDEGSF